VRRRLWGCGVNSDDVRLLVQAVGGDPESGWRLLPGTVTAFAPGLMRVTMDSDPDGVSVEASPLFADVAVSDRVMVLFVPPRGVFVVGVVGRANEAGTLLVWSQVPPFDDGPIRLDDTSALVSSQTVTLYAGRRYLIQLDLLSSWVSGGTTSALLVQTVASVQFYEGLNGSNILLSAPVDVQGGSSFADGLGSATIRWVIEPTQTYATEFEHTVAAYGGEADMTTSLSVTDVGPVPSI
jgi:hypothetical protein